MCLFLFAWKMHPKYSLIAVANRDEYHDRPSLPIERWTDHPQVIAGRDLKHYGTWMGVTDSGKWSVVTNFREASDKDNVKNSRGDLTKKFLIGNQTPHAYASSIFSSLDSYNGFNLLAGDTSSIHYISNRQPLTESKTSAIRKPGIYGLSNHLLNTNWPKVSEGKKALQRLISRHEAIEFATIVDLMSNREKPSDRELPMTGVPMDLERTLSPMFIKTPNYGTRATSMLLANEDGSKIQFSEATFNADGNQITNKSFVIKTS